MPKIQLWEGDMELRLVAESRFPSPRFLDWHRHPFYELGLVLSGAAVWRLGSRSRPRACHAVAAGEVILVPPEAGHREELESEKEVRLAWIGFDSAAPTPSWAGRPVALGDDADEVVRAFRTIYREHSLPRNAPRIRLAIQTLLLLISRQAEGGASVAPDDEAPTAPGLNPRQLRCVEAAAHTLRRNLNSRLTITQVASYHSLSAAHFSTLFHRRYGMAPRAFLRRARVDRAEELLTGSDLTVKEIAAAAGFADSAHFCKAFRALRGATPRSVRG